MKPVYYAILILVAGVFAQDAWSQSQSTTRVRPKDAAAAASEDQSLPQLTSRAATQNKTQKQNIDDVVWLREIYRIIDLEKEDNAALYYPTQPIGTRMNLFTLIFKLMAQNKIKAYDYLGDREIFTDKYLYGTSQFRKMLKTYDIPNVPKAAGKDTVVSVEDEDIPSNEVTKYMIKESWYFDQATGMFNSTITAICPMLIRNDDGYSGASQNALFWLPYETIRPYLSQVKIMTSNMNNTLTYTMDDYFRKRMYKGEIIKTTNMMNQSLAQQVGGQPEALKHAQDSIESQLKTFEQKLWIPADTTKIVDKKGVKTSKTSKTSAKKDEKSKETKAPKSEKAQSSPTKSVRRTR